MNPNENWTNKTALYLSVVIAASLLTYIPLLFPISLIRLMFYAVVAYGVYTKSASIDRKYLVAFPLVAAFIDVMPILSIIPFVPSILNIAGIVLSMTLKEKEVHAVHEHKENFKKSA